jgi:hypothetical protein
LNGESLFQDRVRERDLDNFLVEELHSSETFRNWLLTRLNDAFVAPPAGTVRLGKSPQRLQDNRQTDVRMGWFDQQEKLLACILIESKVTADFQPGQAQSYASELEQCRAALGAKSACAMLVAPAAKFSALVGRETFDDCVSIEEIIGFLFDRIEREFLPPELKLRLEARIRLLEALCGKRAGGAWSPITLPEKRAFSELYTQLAAEIVPAMTVRASSDGPKAITKFFEGAKLPPDFPAARIKHEFGSNVATKYANIQFDGLAASEVALAVSGLVDGSGFTIETSGKALFVRKPTPGIDPTAPFEPQREKIRDGLHAIGDLVAWLEGKSADLMQVLKTAAADSTPGSSAPEHPIDGPRLEREMRKALVDIFKQCAALNYRPTGMLDLMEEHGPIGAVRRLIANPISDGFNKLALLGRLDLAVERLALQDRWAGVFSEKELDICRRRLS